MEVTSNILIGDVRTGLKSLRKKSVHCCVTSPAYWGLRDYGVEGQLGMERTPEEFVANLVDVFQCVWEVLRDDGTLWLNIGDSYASSPKKRTAAQATANSTLVGSKQTQGGVLVQPNKVVGGLKAKDLVGIPWRLALALQDAGWYLRSDIIWFKPNPMPSSVRDRCTKSHEYLFLLTKSKRYFYDEIAISEASTDPKGTANRYKSEFSGTPEGAVVCPGDKEGQRIAPKGMREFDGTRNKRSVWTIPTRSFRGAHFACFPPDLVEPCILAGTSAHGCCSECGSPWRRITNRTKLKRNRPNDFTKRTGEEGTGNSCSNSVAGVSVETLGWEPTCSCSAEVVPCTVLDPFSGSGTTGAVANVLGRNYVGTELNPEYAAMWDMRLADVQKWWAKRNGKKPKKRRVVSPRQGDLF